MKKTIFMLSALCLIILAGCGTQEKTALPESKKIVDCGIQDNCFLQQLGKCEPTTYTTGLGPSIQFDLTIKGIEGNKCVIHYLAAENPMPQFKNTEMTCKIPKKTYTMEEYEQYFQNNIASICQGTYIDAMKALGVENI